jgi:transposase-like protein
MSRVEERGLDRSPVGITERSGGIPTGDREIPDPEVSASAKRRRFSAEYKERIVREVAACVEPGSIGALLRREGLYSSHLVAWRKQLERHGSDGLKSKRRGPKPAPVDPRVVALERENKRLVKRLAQAEAVIEFQKKVHELLGIPLKHLPSEGDA